MVLQLGSLSFRMFSALIIISISCGASTPVFAAKRTTQRTAPPKTPPKKTPPVKTTVTKVKPVKTTVTKITPVKTKVVNVKPEKTKVSKITPVKTKVVNVKSEKTKVSKITPVKTKVANVKSEKTKVSKMTPVKSKVVNVKSEKTKIAKVEPKKANFAKIGGRSNSAKQSARKPGEAVLNLKSRGIAGVSNVKSQRPDPGKIDQLKVPTHTQAAKPPKISRAEKIANRKERNQKVREQMEGIKGEVSNAGGSLEFSMKERKNGKVRSSKTVVKDASGTVVSETKTKSGLLGTKMTHVDSDGNKMVSKKGLLGNTKSSLLRADGTKIEARKNIFGKERTTITTSDGTKQKFKGKGSGEKVQDYLKQVDAWNARKQESVTTIAPKSTVPVGASGKVGIAPIAESGGSVEDGNSGGGGDPWAAAATLGTAGATLGAAVMQAEQAKEAAKQAERQAENDLKMRKLQMDADKKAEGQTKEVQSTYQFNPGALAPKVDSGGGGNTIVDTRNIQSVPVQPAPPPIAPATSVTVSQPQLSF